MKKNVKAVLFDMDGVLANSEIYTAKAAAVRNILAAETPETVALFFMPPIVQQLERTVQHQSSAAFSDARLRYVADA